MSIRSPLPNGARGRVFAPGTHTIRVQNREDGLGIGQIVLSAVKYFSTAPGTLKNDTTVLTK